ncbi:MAG: TonB family protein [Xanthomonadaceae bacterium]|nr:TonB family protein [Xanthomonadaceae bacterium]
MAADALATLLEGLVATSLAMAMVLLLRVAWRRLLGPGLLPLLWLLVPLVQVAVLLPAPIAPVVESTDEIAATGAPTMGPVTVIAMRDDVATPLLAIWWLGALMLAAHLVRQQRRFRRRLGSLTRRPDGHFQAATAQVGPVVIGSLQPRIILPADFEQRFDVEQRELILAHERSHVRRGDVAARWVASALRCLYWFNPLIHVAAARLRLDQELAADADVLHTHPHARRRYAETLLEEQLAVPGLPVGCLWQSSHPLKERILMLKHPATPRLPHRTGIGLAMAIVASCCTLAWAGQPARAPDPSTIEATSADVDPVTYRRISRPSYPPAAVANRQSGNVVLEVLVGTDGVPREVKVSKASAPGVFDETAMASVKAWRFNPARKDGQPVESWVLVPICYATGPSEGTASDKCEGPDAVEALDVIHTRPALAPVNPG